MLRRCMGPDKNEGNDMTQWVLNQNWQVVPWLTLRKITAEQLAPSNEVEQQKQAFFNDDIRQILGEYFSLTVDGVYLETGDVIDEEYEKNYGPTPFLTNVDEVPRSVPVADCVDVNGQLIFSGYLTDAMISSEVLLPQG